jgi:acyl carrier protein
MENTSVEEFVISTISTVCNFERAAITPQTSLADLGMDSLTFTAFASHVEATYECEINVDQMLDFLQAPLVADVVAIVQKLATQARGVAADPRSPRESGGLSVTG